MLVALAGLALVPYAVSRVRGSGLVGGWSAGFAFAFGALVTKLSADALASRDVVAFLAWLRLVGAAAVVGILSQMSALQRRPVAQVAPVAFAIETLVPVALAPVILGESWRSGGAGLLLVASFGLVVAGAVTLEHSVPLDRLLSPPSGGDGEPATAQHPVAQDGPATGAPIVTVHVPGLGSVTHAVRRLARALTPLGWGDLALQIAVFQGLGLLYALTGIYGRRQAETAVANSRGILDVERAIGSTGRHHGSTGCSPALSSGTG